MGRHDDPILEFARALMSAGDPSDLMRVLARLAREEIDAEWAGVWTYARRERKFSLQCSDPGDAVPPVSRKAGRKGDLLSEAIARRSPVVHRGCEATETVLQHLDPSRHDSVAEVFGVPFTLDSDRVGLLELIRERPTPPDAIGAQCRILAAVSSLASSAAATIVRSQAGRESQMAAINRLMQLYDVSQVFHSTLERAELLPVIANRMALILEAPFCRIWLKAEEGEGIVCAFPETEGEAPRLDEGEAPPWAVYLSAKSLLVPVVAENPNAAGIDEFYGAGQAGSLICVRMTLEEDTLGVVEVIRPPEEPAFGEDQRDFMEELVRQAAIALRNCNLFLAEKKAHVLDALLEISREITSTLDLGRVLATIVNRAQTVVPSERCAILLADGSRLDVRAVSGHVEVDRKDPAIRELEGILTWAHMGGQALYISELDGEIEAEREETREKFRRYFEQSGMKTFVAYPLKDEEGSLGTISIESSQPYFVAEDKLEAFNILANQATVAIRNASLYRQIPLINIMQPIAGWRSRMRALPRWTWIRGGAVASVVVAALILVPWNMKIAGRLVVLPARNSSVTAEIEGVVEAVHFREGDQVRRGDLIATLVDREHRIRLEETRSLYEIADRQVAEHEAALDRSAARQARTRRDQLREEFAILRDQLGRTRIGAPVSGVILTPRLERRVGSFLERGEVLCRIADMSEVAVEILVPESDIAEVQVGQRVRLKMDSFPTATFSARVEIMGQSAVEQDHERSFVIRGRVEGDDLPLKNGMVGRAKIEIGRRSAGYVLLRKPARFVWRHLWPWLP